MKNERKQKKCFSLDGDKFSFQKVFPFFLAPPWGLKRDVKIKSLAAAANKKKRSMRAFSAIILFGWI